MTINAEATAGNGWALRNVAVVNPVEERVVVGDLLWNDGIITEIVETNAIAPGGWVIPAGIDCHVHLTFDATPKTLEEAADLSAEQASARVARHLSIARQSGIAVVRDLGDVHWVAGSIDNHDRTRTMALSAGYGITNIDGHGKTISNEIDSSSNITEIVSEQQSHGSTWIKTFVTGGLVGPGNKSYTPTLPIGALKEIVRVAHDHGLRVTSHVHGHEGVEESIRAGVDCVEHGSGMTLDQAERMAAVGIPLVATLLPVARILASTAADSEYMQVLKQLRSMQETAVVNAIKAGTLILAGTDAGTPHNPIGALGSEMQELAALGVSRWDALRSGTSSAAEFLDVGPLGVLGPGSPASFSVVASDPLTDFRILDRPDLVVMGGTVVDPESEAEID